MDSNDPIRLKRPVIDLPLIVFLLLVVAVFGAATWFGTWPALSLL